MSFLCEDDNVIEQKHQDTGSQSLTTDPLYFVMVGVFALLTTALPAVLGQPRFLPIAQALALTVFLAIPLSAGLWRRTVLVMGIWLLTATATMVALSYFIPQQVEGSLANGFELRTDLIAWTFGASEWPSSPRTAPLSQLVELLGVSVGALVTAGLVGNWFLMRAVNAAGFSIGVLIRSIDGPASWLLSIPVWSLVRISGLAGLVILLSQPILSSQWSLRFYVQNQRSLVIWSTILLAFGLLLGLVMPTLWQSMVAAFVQ